MIFMRISRGFCLHMALVATPCLVAADQVDEIRANFALNGKPIQPGIVELFETDPADLDPVVRAVDVSAAQNSNRFFDNGTKEPLGWVRCKKHDPDDGSSFAYEFLGALPSGTLVVHTATSTGGAGTSESALLFSVSMEPALPGAGKTDPHAVLHLLENIVVGDRAGAVFHIQGKQVVITRAKAIDGETQPPLTINDPGPAATPAPASP